MREHGQPSITARYVAIRRAAHQLLDRPPVFQETPRWAAQASCGGGGIVFDYGVPLSDLGPLQRAVFEAKAERVRALGEPWRTYLGEEEVRKGLGALGFASVEDLASGEVNERYFANRRDGLRVGSVGHVVKANPAPEMEAGFSSPLRSLRLRRST